MMAPGYVTVPGCHPLMITGSLPALLPLVTPSYSCSGSGSPT